jgi:hypothetical protein
MKRGPILQIFFRKILQNAYEIMFIFTRKKDKSFPIIGQTPIKEWKFFY